MPPYRGGACRKINDQDPGEASSSSAFKPEIVVMYCRNAVDRREDLISAVNAVADFKLKVHLLPCSSKIEVSHLLKILESGVDGIEVIACPDMLCEFLVGNSRADKRIERARSLLRQIGMPAERIGLDRGVAMPVKDLIALAQRRAEIIRNLGQNPLGETPLGETPMKYEQGSIKGASEQ